MFISQSGTLSLLCICFAQFEFLCTRLHAIIFFSFCFRGKRALVMAGKQPERDVCCGIPLIHLGLFIACGRIRPLCCSFFPISLVKDLLLGSVHVVRQAISFSFEISRRALCVLPQLSYVLLCPDDVFWIVGRNSRVDGTDRQWSYSTDWSQKLEPNSSGKRCTFVLRNR